MSRYDKDILRAMREFFNRPDLDRGSFLESNEKSEGLFNEWFLYNFVLANGKTTLTDFIAENPLKLSAVEMILYQNLLETNMYSLFEVISIDIDTGLMLKNSQTGKKVYVHERKLTSQVKPGNVFFGRIGKVDDHYEIVGADTFLFEGLNESIKKYLDHMKFKLTPKEVHNIWKKQ